MRVLSSVALVLTVAACQKSPQAGPTPQNAGGDFSYRMNVGITPVEGEFSIAGDTVMLEAADHGCRNLNLGMSVTARSASFACVGRAEFRVVVDLMQPTFSRWSSSEAVRRTRQVCDRWTVTEKGERVCSANRTEVYTENVPISGRLQVARVAASSR